MGEIISHKGIRPDPMKIKAVQEMTTPKTKSDVQRALGVVNFIGKYIPNLSSNTEHLRSLLKNDSAQQWMPEHDVEWKYIKDALTRNPVLQFYNPSLPTKISSDASSSGLGSVLLQQHEGEWKPVAYASRALTDAETRYAQIEKETLSLVYGCQKFHNYIYGRPFCLETDHKPLLAMAKRVLAEIPPRLQRLFLKLTKYKFTIEYKPGKDLTLADAISRASLPLTGEEKLLQDELNEELQLHINAVVSSLPVSSGILEAIKQETAKDPVLKEVQEQILNGWSSKNTAASSYATLQSELTLVDGLILKGSRIVVPMSLRPKILGYIHDGHLGIEKCRRRARQAVYWPRLNADIDRFCKSCPTCNKFQYSQPSEPLIMRDPPKGPWERIGTDIFHMENKNYIVAIDAYSNYIEVAQLPSVGASTVIKFLKNIFARFGIPYEVLSDNVPFDSVEFKSFAKSYDFKSTTSSPKYPQSNGLAEKGVQIAKRLLRKAKDANEDFALGLLSYRNSPQDHGKSPAQLLMGRSLRTRLPQAGQLGQGSISKRKQRTTGKTLPQLKQGEVVRIQNQTGDWDRKAQVVKEAAPRSYLVQTEDGTILRRNRRALRVVLEPPVAETPPRNLGQTEVAPQTNHEQCREGVAVTSGQNSNMAGAARTLDQNGTPNKVQGEEGRVQQEQPSLKGQGHMPELRRSKRLTKPVKKLNL